MLTAMGDVMREAYARGWITSRDGNISVKIDKSIYITPSGVRKFTIQPEHAVKIEKVHDKLVSLNQYGSIESEMHFKILRQKGVKSVVHLHPTHIVAAMHAGFNLQHLAMEFVELGRYTRVGRTVPALSPGSKELAVFTAERIADADVVGQERHGVTAKGTSPWHAFEHIERLNHICEIVLASGVRPDDII